MFPTDSVSVIDVPQPVAKAPAMNFRLVGCGNFIACIHTRMSALSFRRTGPLHRSNKPNR